MTAAQLEIGDNVLIAANQRKGTIIAVWVDQKKTQYLVRFVLDNGDLSECWLFDCDFTKVEE